MLSFWSPSRVIPSPFALRLRTALSAAKGLRVNSARNLFFVCTGELCSSPRRTQFAGTVEKQILRPKTGLRMTCRELLPPRRLFPFLRACDRL